MKKLSDRDKYVWIGTLLTILILLMTDPDNGIITSLPFGAGTLANLVILVKSSLYITFLHISRKMILDYIDLRSLYEQCKTTPQGSGLFTIGVGLFSIAISICIFAATR